MKTSAQYLLTALAFTTIASSAIAASKNVVINAQVVGTCEFVDATDVTIPFTDLKAGMADQSKQGSTQFWCSNGAGYSIAVGDGNNLEEGSKHMISGEGDKLPYALTIDKAIGTGAGKGSPITLGITATVKGTDLNNAVVANDYTDTVTLTLIP